MVKFQCRHCGAIYKELFHMEQIDPTCKICRIGNVRYTTKDINIARNLLTGEEKVICILDIENFTSEYAGEIHQFIRELTDPIK